MEVGKGKQIRYVVGNEINSKINIGEEIKSRISAGKRSYYGYSVFKQLKCKLYHQLVRPQSLHSVWKRGAMNKNGR